jgi:HD-GYP domain-containing protein (c-di-GMP phosphodiesterase class II)
VKIPYTHWKDLLLSGSRGRPSRELPGASALADVAAQAANEAELSLERRYFWVRAVAAIAIAVAVVLQRQEVPAWEFIAGGAGFALAYNFFPVAYLAKRGQATAARNLGTVLDGITLFVASLMVFKGTGARGVDTDLWLIFFVYVVGGATRFGPQISMIHTAWWYLWLAFLTVLFFDAGTYTRDQLPTRLVFLLVMGFLGYWQANELRRGRVRLEAQSRDTLVMLATIVEARDSDAGMHLQRIREYCQAVASRLGLSQRLARELGYAAMIHDVGKANVPDAILKKSGPLTDEERRLIEQHTAWGDRILGDRPSFKLARQIARWHHEHWDGSGYPDGLAGEKIPLAARIVAVADVYDALTSRRPYKDAWPSTPAMAEMTTQRGRHFDPQVLDIFAELWNEGVIDDIRRRFQYRENHEVYLPRVA